MKKIKTLLTVLISFLIIIIIILYGIWLIAIPNEIVSQKIESFFIKSPYKIKINNLKKGLLLDLKVESIKIADENGELGTIENIKLNINPFYLLLKTAKLSFVTEFAGGRIDGTSFLKKDHMQLETNITGIEIEKIEYLKQTGLNGKGIVSGNITYNGTKGKIHFTVKEAHLADISKNNIYLPLSYFSEIKGLLLIENLDIDIKSVNFSGNSIYARIKGMIKKGYANMVLEVMPEPDFADKGKLILIKRYEKSPGFYSIPVKTKLF